MANETTFKPSEVWTPGAPNFEIDEAIQKARAELNNKNPDMLIHQLGQSVKKADSGIVYADFKGEEPQEYSDTDALVIFNPFANTITANMLVRAEFIREVAKQSQVRDEEGKLK